MSFVLEISARSIASHFVKPSMVTVSMISPTGGGVHTIAADARDSRSRVGALGGDRLENISRNVVTVQSNMSSKYLT